MQGHPFPGGTGGWVTVSIMTDGTHALGQDMAQVSRYELETAEGFDLCAAMISPVLPLKAHGVAVAGDEAGVADGSFTNVGTEVFDRTLTISKVQLCQAKTRFWQSRQV